jgi:ankyrin repeat protein
MRTVRVPLMAKRFLPVLVAVLALLPSRGTAVPGNLNEQLVEAARQGDVASVTKLLNDGADPNAKNEDGVPVSWQAIAAGNLQLIRLLVEKGADINGKG